MGDSEEKTQDQVLAELVGLDEPPPPIAPNRSPQTFAPAGVDANLKQPEESTAPAQEADKPSGEVTGTPKQQDPRQERARAALQRSGFSDSEIGAMDAETLLARGLKRADVLASDDEAYRKLRDMERRLEDSDKSGKPTKDKAKKPSEVDQIRKALEPLQEALADDGQATGPLVETIAKLVERLDKHESALSDAQNGLRQTNEQREAELVSLSRGRLSERFTELDDEGSFAKVKERMALLAKDGSFRDPSLTVEQRLDNVMEAALRSLGYSARTAEAPLAAGPTKADPRASGSPLSPTSPPDDPNKQLTPDERQWLIFQGIEKGMTPDEIKAQVG